MIAVAQELCGASAVGQQKNQGCRVGFRRVAGAAGEDQVVTPVVRALAPPRSHVVQGDAASAHVLAAVGADRAVTLQQPGTRRGVCRPACWE